MSNIKTHNIARICFLPRDTAAYQWIKESLKTANIEVKDIEVIRYTKGKKKNLI